MDDGAFDPRLLIDYTTALDAALELADIGVPVFPVALTYNKALAKYEKKPVISNWRNNASTDERQIRQWFTDARLLVGMPTGIRSGWDVVDVDPRHGGDVWLKENQYRLPATTTHQTVQGGTHLLLRHHPGMRSSTGKIAPGVDVRAEGGFIVYWPGHGFPVSGGPIAPWPEWLIELAMRGQPRQATNNPVPLSTRKPPSAQVVVELLNRMPNGPEVPRDTYVSVLTAAAGCHHALDAAGTLTPEDALAIEDAAVGWAERYGTETDERAKWREDWIHRGDHAGWQSLTKVAAALIPGYALERAAEDFNDYDDLSEPAPASSDPCWVHRLRRTKNKGIKAGSLLNVRIALQYAPEWQGVLALNTFSGNTELLAKPPYDKTFDQPRQLKNVDLAYIREWLETYHIDATTEIVRQAIQATAAEHPYHPIVAMLDTLKWDGVPRLDTWMIRHLGVEDTPLHRAFSARWPISMVARVRQPGCKADAVLTLEGRQGLLKSTIMSEWAKPWFTDHMPDLSSKDAQLQLCGIWVLEFAEYSGLGRADVNRAKNFLTIVEDRLRKPYAELVENTLRQCVFVITLNPEAQPYLKDVTGNRRFWVVPCGATWGPAQRADIAAFRAEREQLLAEADHRYRQGAIWWLEEPDLVQAHEESLITRVDGGPLFESVAQALQAMVAEGETPTFKSICNRMGLHSARDLTLSVQKHVGQALTLLGWRPARRREAGSRETYYERRPR